MHVGILGGTGPLGRGLAARLASAGASVVIGSRDAHRAEQTADDLKELWADVSHAQGLDVVGRDNEAAARCDVVIVATPWDAAVAAVGGLGERLAGKVVISVANALYKQGKELVALGGPRGSVAVSLHAALPSSLVAAAGHHLPAAVLLDPKALIEADVLVCSDHPKATSVTIDLISQVPGLRPLNAGSLSQAAAIEAFTAVLVNLNVRYKAHSTLRLGGIDSGGAR